VQALQNPDMAVSVTGFAAMSQPLIMPEPAFCASARPTDETLGLHP
jgi:hypothetical protein